MTEPDPTARTSAPPSPVRVALLPRIALFLFLPLLVFLTIHRLNPPDAVSPQAPPAEFASGRALKHLQSISKNPHPVGALEHQQVRDYILAELSAMGLNPELQKATTVQQLPNNSVRGGSVENIAARLKGNLSGSNAKALMLVGHYDSRPNAFGASDDGAAVATMMETLRALKARPTLRNDIIFLFTDAEEVGLLGARAFMAEHPWAKDVGLVLNFEARGTSGPVVLFETSQGNNWLIDTLGRTVPHPVANSLMYDIYRILPYDTDLTVFKGAGLAGMNFAFIDDSTHYHTHLDNLTNLDERSLQHQGSYALALAAYFGDLNLETSRRGNAIYFDLLGATLVHYPAAWVLPLTVLVILAYVVVLLLGLRSRQVTLGRTVLSFLAFVLAMIVAAGAVILTWWLIRSLHSAYQAMAFSDVYHSGFYFLSFTLLTVAIVSALCVLARKRLGTPNLALGALLCGVLLLLASSFYLPGGTYLLIWPMLANLSTLGFLLVTKEEGNSTIRVAVLALGATPAILLLVPIIYLLFIALTVNLAGAVALMLVLLLGLLTPQLSYLTSRRRWLLPGASVAGSLLCIALGLAYSGFDKAHPRPDNLFYGLNADKHEAVWASSDRTPDEWTAQFLSRTPQAGPLEEFFPGISRPHLKATAPIADLLAPDLKVLDDSLQGDVRMLRLRLTSPRQAPLISVYTEQGAEIRKVAIDGKQDTVRQSVNAKTPWVIRYYALPAEGIELVFETNRSQPFKVVVVDQSYGLPPLPDVTSKTRPENVMPSSSLSSEATFVRRSFSF